MFNDIVAVALAASGIGRLLRAVGAWRGVLALAYHRIGDGSGSPFDHGLWSATPDAFDAQVRFLKENFDIIGPGDLAGTLRRSRGRYALITFDDGYRDNYEQAFPILRSHGVGATFFVSTGFLDRPRLSWWDEIAWMVRTSPRRTLSAGTWLATPVAFDEPDRERAIRLLLARYRSLPGEATGAYLEFLAEATGSGRYRDGSAAEMWMTWDMVREMKGAGMWIGGHTASHPVLSRLPRHLQDAEIAECRERIEAELREPMACFSYPNGQPGDFNDDTRSCLADHGVEFAFSYYGGFRGFDDWDPYDIRRVGVENETTFDQFRAVATLPQILPW